MAQVCCNSPAIPAGNGTWRCAECGNAWGKNHHGEWWATDWGKREDQLAELVIALLEQGAKDDPE